MKIIPDPRFEKELNKLSPVDGAKVKEYLELFKEYGFGLTAKHLKKISNRVWELRPGDWRLFLLQKKTRLHHNSFYEQTIAKNDKEDVQDY